MLELRYTITMSLRRPLFIDLDSHSVQAAFGRLANEFFAVGPTWFGAGDYARAADEPWSASLLRSQRNHQSIQIELSNSTPRPLVRQFTNDVHPCVVFANSRSILTVSSLYMIVAWRFYGRT